MESFSEKVKNDDINLTIFPQTKLMPTYIFCFTVGNYNEIKSDKGTVDMSLYYVPVVE